MKEYINYILSDAERYIGNKNIKYILRLKLRYTHPSFNYICTYRKANYYFSNKSLLRYFYMIKLRRLSIKYGYQINIRTKIKGGLFLGHRGSVVINGDTVIGEKCNIAQGVTIGQENRGKRKGAPIIGDRVWIGANSIIVGRVNIGNNVLIAPNSFINFDVPSNSIVIGNPAKIISNENATEGYI